MQYRKKNTWQVAGECKSSLVVHQITNETSNLLEKPTDNYTQSKGKVKLYRQDSIELDNRKN